MRNVALLKIPWGYLRREGLSGLPCKSYLSHNPKSPYLAQHAVQLILGLCDTVAVGAVDHEDEALGVLKVVPPERADAVLEVALGGTT